MTGGEGERNTTRNEPPGKATALNAPDCRVSAAQEGQPGPAASQAVREEGQGQKVGWRSQQQPLATRPTLGQPMPSPQAHPASSGWFFFSFKLHKFQRILVNK